MGKGAFGNGVCPIQRSENPSEVKKQIFNR